MRLKCFKNFLKPSNVLKQQSRHTTNNKASKLNKITEVTVDQSDKPEFLNTLSLHYKQNGEQRHWDILKQDNSATALIYNVSNKNFYFVRHFRPAVYYASVPREDKETAIDTNKYSPNLGITVELCTGPILNDETAKECAARQILDCFGFKIKPEVLEQMGFYQAGVGTIAGRRFSFYCEVDDGMKVDCKHKDGEVEVVKMNYEEAWKYVHQCEVQSPAGVLFAIYWYLENKEKRK